MTISCIIPTCDRPGSLAEALRSVRSQTRPADEIIVVDNGITPVHPDNVTVIRTKPRIGASAARNTGAAAAHGDYLAFLDDDDLWDPHYLGYMEAALGKSEAAVGSLDALSNGVPIPYKDASGSLDIRTLCIGNPGITGSNFIIKRDLFAEIEGYDIELPAAEDKSLALEVLRRGKQIRMVPEAHAVLREHESERLSRPIVLAQGTFRFARKYQSLMRTTDYFFNMKKGYRYEIRAGKNLAWVPYLLFSFLTAAAKIAYRTR